MVLPVGNKTVLGREVIVKAEPRHFKLNKGRIWRQGP